MYSNVKPFTPFPSISSNFQSCTSIYSVSSNLKPFLSTLDISSHVQSFYAILFLAIYDIFQHLWHFTPFQQFSDISRYFQSFQPCSYITAISRYLELFQANFSNFQPFKPYQAIFIHSNHFQPPHLFLDEIEIVTTQNLPCNSHFGPKMYLHSPQNAIMFYTCICQSEVS